MPLPEVLLDLTAVITTCYHLILAFCFHDQHVVLNHLQKVANIVIALAVALQLLNQLENISFPMISGYDTMIADLNDGRLDLASPYTPFLVITGNVKSHLVVFRSPPVRKYLKHLPSTQTPREKLQI